MFKPQLIASLALVGTLTLVLPVSAQESFVSIDSAQKINSANELVRNGEFDKAIEEYQQVTPDAADRDELTYNQAVAQFRKGDVQSAQTMFADASKSNDTSIAASSRYNLGNCVYSTALKTSEQDKSAAIEQLREAISHYRDSLRLSSDNVDARANIELAAEMIRKWKEEQTQEEQTQEEQQDQQQQKQDQQSQDQQSKDQQDSQSQQDQDQKQNQKSQSEESKTDQQNSDQQQSEGEQSDSQDQKSQQEQDQSKDEQPKENESGSEKQQQDSEQTDSQKDESKDGQSKEEQSQQDAGQHSQEQKSQEEQSDSQDQQQKEQQADQQQFESNNQSQQNKQQSQADQQSAGEPQAEEQVGEEKQDGSQIPAGQLTSAGEQDENGKPRETVAMADPNAKDGLMTKEEAMKMLQAVRDRDMLRRLRQEQLERSRHVPVDKDW